MRYIFEMNLHPDGDFGFPFLVPCGLIWNDDEEKYTFEKVYLNRKTLSAEIDPNYYYFHKNQILNSV